MKKAMILLGMLGATGRVKYEGFEIEGDLRNYEVGYITDDPDKADAETIFVSLDGDEESLRKAIKNGSKVYMAGELSTIPEAKDMIRYIVHNVVQSMEFLEYHVEKK